VAAWHCGVVVETLVTSLHRLKVVTPLAETDEEPLTSKEFQDRSESLQRNASVILRRNLAYPCIVVVPADGSDFAADATAQPQEQCMRLDGAVVAGPEMEA